ncbi:MAG: DUF3187 family protein [Gemmatimonadota bacterium]
MRSSVLLACGVGAVLASGHLEAQSLPLLHPINPAAESRSGLYFQPYLAPSPRWRVALGVDYGSMAELNFRLSLADTAYILDAEALRLNLSASRDLDARHFVTAEAWLGGSYSGFMDGFLNWYHGLFGIRYPERDGRPRNSFAYEYKFSDNRKLRFAPHGAYLGDIRLGLGRRNDEHSQSMLSLTLPTSTAGPGYDRGTISLSLLNTFRYPITPRLLYEGSANLGFTPTHGPLRSLQERLFVLGTSGVRWRTFGGLWSFANLYLHSPYYSTTTEASQLQRWEMTLDFGWIIRSKSGREFRFGMTEDLQPGGPAVDADFRVGYSW